MALWPVFSQKRGGEQGERDPGCPGTRGKGPWVPGNAGKETLGAQEHGMRVPGEGSEASGNVSTVSYRRHR